MTDVPDYLQPRYKTNLKRRLRFENEEGSTSPAPAVKTPRSPVINGPAPTATVDVKAAPVVCMQRKTPSPPVSADPIPITADGIVRMPKIREHRGKFKARQSIPACESPESASCSIAKGPSSSKDIDRSPTFGSLVEGEGEAMPIIEPQASPYAAVPEHLRPQLAQFLGASYADILEVYKTIPDDKLKNFHDLAMKEAMKLKEKYASNSSREVTKKG